MDLTQSIVPRSDQLNADEMLHPQTFTVREVVKGKAEQPFDFLLEETDRAYRPGVTMRRIIVAGWGPDSSAYVGRRFTLYRDPSVKFGGSTVGGLRISHMSHLDKPLNERLQVTRGKREVYTVQPLTEAPKRPTAPSHMDRLADTFRAAGVAENLWLDYCTNVLLRPVNAPTELSPEDADKVIADLTADAQGEGGGAS